MRKTSISYCDPSEYADSWRSGLWKGTYMVNGQGFQIYEDSLKACRNRLAHEIRECRKLDRIQKPLREALCTR